MSAQTFYQTFYQTDQLYRLADERWDSTTTVAVAEILTDQKPDLLSELATLAETVVADGVLVAMEIVEPVSLPTMPELVVSLPSPEPLPQPAPRPTVPSVLPPVQQRPRLPQLNHKVLLLADEELDPSNLLFLEKILKAVNLNVNGVDLLNLHGVREVDFAELLRGKYINHFITFGVPFERLNLDIMMDRYVPVRFEGITFLMVDSLPTVEADQNLKKRLWGALQRVFLQRQ